MQVHYSEGVATHTGPEPCVGIREGDGEASAGERIGQPLSSERNVIPSADVVSFTEGNMDGHESARARLTRRCLRPWHVRTLLVREPGDLAADRQCSTAGPRRKGEEP